MTTPTEPTTGSEEWYWQQIKRGPDAFRSGEPRTEHEAHWGDHNEYACRLSGPHCWACNEPWPCRTSRGIEAEARAASPLDRDRLFQEIDERFGRNVARFVDARLTAEGEQK